MEILILFLLSNYMMLAGLMWSDWWVDRKPSPANAIFVFLVYVFFLPAFWLSRLGRD